MPCAAVPSTRTVTPPLRKSLGAVRRDLPRAKNGQVIKSCASRGAKSPGKARNRTNGARADSAATAHAQPTGQVGSGVATPVRQAEPDSESAQDERRPTPNLTK